MDTLKAPQITPKVAIPARSPAAAPKVAAPEVKPDQVPLQLRIPRTEARAIKITVAQAEQTISKFMLACFHTSMKSGGTP